MADSGKSFRLKIISPDRVFFEGDVDMIELRTSEGELGVLKGHIPLTAILVPGVFRIKGCEGGDKEAAMHSGFVEIQSDHVTVLAESCEWPEEIDANRAKEAQIRAERRLRSGEEGIDVARAELALRKALLRIEMATKTEK